MNQSPEQPAARVPVRLVVRVSAVVVMVATVVFLISSSRETQTVSEVIEEIHEIALDEPQGGLIGRWWVSATGVDPGTGRLESFKLECGPIHIAARSARVIVNHHTDSFQFEMWDVVMARVPGPGEPEDQDSLRVLDRFVLGPLPYPRGIAPDPPGTGLPTLTVTPEA